MGLLGLTPEAILARILAALIAMTVHEFAHCYVADRMGDPTPRSMGRLTLNPMVHINWFGFLMFVLIGFGPLGSAPISPWRMRDPRLGTLLAVGAGPVSNLLLATLFAIIWRLIPINAMFDLSGTTLIGEILLTMVSFNVLLFVFNLIPLFPLDGWRIVLSLLPPDLADWWNRNQQTSYYIFMGLILISFVQLRGIPNILDVIIGQPTNAITRLLLGF